MEQPVYRRCGEEAGRLGIKGGQVTQEIRVRLSPPLFEHINFHGFYPFNRPDLGGELRELRDPSAADE
ncbi:transposase [Nonomuraea sediminis]|uniref:transposase n=1 Tax=Nonomuraea sediminis TaxID=2835864 RepID=UPI001BDD066F|nr:transposase [Nonomuraea sediminis]